MAYCTYEADVWPRSSKFTARDAEGGLEATSPSRTQCDALIDQVAAEIDGRLRMRGITTPVADPEGVAMLLPINAIGAAAAILRSAFPQKEGIGGDGGAAAELHEEYKDWLARIDAGLLDRDAAKDGANVVDGFPRRGWGPL